MKEAICIVCSSDFYYKPSQKRGKYCSQKCHSEGLKRDKEKLFEERYQIWINGGELPLKNPRKLIKKFVTKRDGHKCNICGISEWQNKEITLWCDHIDGDATNNKPDNFQLVCPNCDSQQDTFGAKNTGKGRKSRGLPQYG